MSLTISSTDPDRPSLSMVDSMRWWGTDPKASWRSSQVRTRLCLRRLESVIMERRMKLCSAQPSNAKNPFWASEKAEVAIAQVAILLAIIAE